MTNKELAQQLWATASDASRSDAERVAALDELSLLKKRAKVGWGKLGLEDTDVGTMRVKIAQDAHAAAEAVLDDLVAETGTDPDVLKELMACGTAADPLDEQPAKPKPRQAAIAAASERGLISAEVRRLLEETDMPYCDIVDAVKALYPDARTTARSVASVASDMRKAGRAVSQRRREASK